VSCGVGHRLGSDLAWRWPWLAAIALILPLVWEPPYAPGVALKSRKKKKKEKKEQHTTYNLQGRGRFK